MVAAAMSPRPETELGFTPGMDKVLALAAEEAKNVDSTDSTVGTEHVLLALTRYENGIAAQVMEELGVRERIATRLHEIMASAAYFTESVHPDFRDK